MSRVGRLPIPIPAGVDIDISGTHVVVKGPKAVLGRPPENVLALIDS